MNGYLAAAASPSWSVTTAGPFPVRTLPTCLSIESSVKLVNCWGDLETGLEDGLLTLKPDVLGPFDETAQIPLGLDVATDAEVACAFLKQRVDYSLGLWLLGGQRGGCHLLYLISFSLVNKNEIRLAK